MYKCFENENDLIFHQTKVKSLVWPVYHSITSIVNALTDVTLVVQNVAGGVQVFLLKLLIVLTPILIRAAQSDFFSSQSINKSITIDKNQFHNCLQNILSCHSDLKNGTAIIDKNRSRMAKNFF